MEYKIKRENPPDELYHAKEGEEREDHKYIARVLLKKVNVGGKKKNRYRYFYDKKSYQAYLNSKKSKELKPKTSEGNLLEKIKSGVEKGQNLVNSFLKKNTNKKVEELGSSYESNQDLKDAITLLIGGVIGYTVKELLSKKKDSKVEPTVEPEPEPIKPVVKPSQIKKMTDNLIDENEANKSIKAGITVKLPNGEYKRFDSYDEYEAYQERLEYQKNEPEFMKQIPDISENDVFTAMEDMSKINELYDPSDDMYSRNCANCSAAYELRRRGYDVEAAPRDEETYNGQPERIYDYFEDAKYIGVKSDGSTITYSEEFIRDPYYMSEFDTMKYGKESEVYTSEYSYTPDSIEKAIKDNNPPGSRGMIDVYWNNGGGHSIVYEVDTKGEITIRDSQTYDEYSLDELANRVNSIQMVRTDNLSLKEGILDAVTSNTDKKRRYYVDNGYAYYYY